MRFHTGSRRRPSWCGGIDPVWTACILLTVLGGLAAMSPRPAQAASCCGSILAQADRLGPGESAAVQLRTTGLFTLGMFSGRGDFTPISPGSLDFDGIALLAGSFRLTQTLQLGATAGWNQGIRHYGEVTSVGGSFDDTTLGIRYEPLFLENWAFTATALFPTGRTLQESRTRLAADTSSRGSFGLRLGAFHEVAFAEWFLMTEGGVTAYGPERTSGVDQNVSFDAMVMAGYTFRTAAGLAAGLRGTVAPPWSKQGAPLASNVRSRISVVVAGGVPVSPSWTVTGSVSVDPPIGLSRDEPMQVGLNLGLRALLAR